jgi:hypothetical protein
MNLRDIAVKIATGELPAVASQDLKVERLKLCDACQHFSKVLRKCKLCGCWMELKAKLLEARCPIDKW